MIAARALDLPSRHGSGYPAPHDVPCRERVRRALGDVFGLSQFGVNLLELAPGAWSSRTSFQPANVVGPFANGDAPVRGRRRNS